MSEEEEDVCSPEVSGVGVTLTVEEVVSSESENVDVANVVDPVAVDGISDEVDDVCLAKVSGVDVT